MTNICVVHHSVIGTTSKLAESVFEGLSCVAGCTAKLFAIEGADIAGGRYRNDAILSAIDTSDAVIFGCPTFMGGPSAQFKAFADASSDRWEAQRWEGKLCAGFTVGSNPSGDQLATLLYFTVLAAQHGMLWVGIDISGGYDPDGRNRLGAQLGLVSQSSGTRVPEIELATARYLGSRVGRKAKVLTGAGDA